MNKFFTLNYLINSYESGKAEVKMYNSLAKDFEKSMLKSNYFELEPSQRSIDAILNFASQYEVIKSYQTGDVELNLN